MFCRVCNRPVDYPKGNYVRITFEHNEHVYYHNKCWESLTGLMLNRPTKINMQEVRASLQAPTTALGEPA